MSLDRDLRDALQPLAGDPIADAMRVLAALPPAGPLPPDPAPPRAPLPWWLLLAGVALGAVLGLAAARWFGEAPPLPPQPVQPPDPTVVPPKPDAPSTLREKEQPSEYADQLQIMAFGELSIDEPGVGRQLLAPGGYMAAVGTLFDTGPSMAGIYAYANDVRVRLDRATLAMVQPDLVTLQRGRLWLSNVTRPAALVVRADRVDVDVTAAVLMLEARSSGLWACCLEGEALVRPLGGTAFRLPAQQQVEIDRRTGRGELQKVAFAGTLTSWMTRMILQQTDDAELYGRIAQMLDAYLEGAYRDAAAIELRRLGARTAGRLYAALDGMAARPELRLRTASLLADVAEYDQRDWLLALLENDDSDVRAMAFRGLVRVTGAGVEDEAFWRGGDAGARATAVAAWRETLR